MGQVWLASLLVGSGLVFSAAQPSQAAAVPILPDTVIYALGTETTGDVIRSDDPSPTGFTVPSLWWAVQQFGQNLVERWSAYPAVAGAGGRVELLVSSQAWGRLAYLDRFAVAQRFGTTASDFGYNLLVVDRRRTILAAYICDFQAIATPLIPNFTDAQGEPVPDFVSSDVPSPLACQVWINPAIPVSLF